MELVLIGYGLGAMVTLFVLGVVANVEHLEHPVSTALACAIFWPLILPLMLGEEWRKRRLP